MTSPGERGRKPLASSSPFSARRVGLGAVAQSPNRAGARAVLPQISVIVPLRNESANVLPLSRAILEALRNESKSSELILIDDASSDDSWQQMLEARRADGRVRALRHAEHSGQSAALWTGFEACQGEIIVTLDADLQNDPADLPRLLRELADCDLVCGVRARRMDNALRRISSAVARWFRKTVLGVDFRDIGCNFRVFRRPVLQTLLPFNGLHRFLPVLAHDAGAKVKEVVISHHPRTAGRSNYGVWNRLGRGIVDLCMIGWYRKRQMKVVAGIEAVEETAELRNGLMD